MDLSWPQPAGHSVNRGTPNDTYIGLLKKMHLPSAQDMADLIRQTGKGAYLYCKDIAHAYWQLPLDPAD